MSSSLDALIRDLRKFEGRKEVVKALRKRIRKPVPEVRKAIKRRALDILPRSGGLNAWVSKTRITAQIKLSGRSAGVRLRGGRNSTGARSDIRAIDKGRVRAPTWGRKGAGNWHTHTVPERFFGQPVVEAREWRVEIDKAIREAQEVIR